MLKSTYYIAVCDDEPADNNEIAAMTKAVCEEEDIQTEISCFRSAGELLQAIQQKQKFDLLLIDVMMPEKDGIELARELRSEKQEMSIVFISINREMALQGYKVSAARYLEKPLKIEELREAIVFCYGHRRRSEKLLLPVNGVLRTISSDKIYYIEICGRKKRIVQKDAQWDVNLSFDELEDMLAGRGFIRCHKSYLVNVRYVHVFRTSSFELENGKHIPISKHRIKEVREEFFYYMDN